MGEVLKENGFNTSWFGKMHNVRDWMSSQAGPFDLWPSGLGFEAGTSLYGSWTDMKQRCLKPKNKRYKDYGRPRDYDMA